MDRLRDGLAHRSAVSRMMALSHRLAIATLAVARLMAITTTALAVSRLVAIAATALTIARLLMAITAAVARLLMAIAAAVARLMAIAYGLAIAAAMTESRMVAVSHGSAVSASVHLFPVIIIKIARGRAGRGAMMAAMMPPKQPAPFHVFAAKRNPHGQQSQRQKSQKLPIHDPLSLKRNKQ